MSRRHLVSALSALLLGAGCRALGVSDLSRPEPIPPRTAVAVNEVVARINRNAAQVTSLEAQPRVAMRSDSNRGASLQGRMALERPRNFRMVLEGGLSKEADVGSNDQWFWVWTRRSKEKDIYVGEYDAGGNLPPELIFQPDWIVEALGLRPIPDGERAKITLAKAPDPNLEILVHQRADGSGRPVLKKTVVDRTTGEAREHVFYAPDRQTIIARAETTDYRRVKAPGAADSAEVGALIPHRIRLVAMPPGQESFEIEMRMAEVRLNSPFDDARRTAIFAVPDMPGYKVVNLNERIQDGARADARNGSRTNPRTTIRETRPAPDSGTRVELGSPVPVGVDDSARRDGDPAPLAPDLPSGSSPPGAIATGLAPRHPQPKADDEVDPSALQAGGLFGAARRR